jgi:hypothetical protein
MFGKYVTEVFIELYPDACDEPSKRVLMRSDSGPGRSGEEYRFRTRVEGIYSYPGLPNGTEAGQECDQLFAYFKTLVALNRETLYKARVRLAGESATLSINDIGYIVFGGTVTLENGEAILLRRAFQESMDPQHIERAQRKCGYGKN